MPQNVASYQGLHYSVESYQGLHSLIILSNALYLKMDVVVLICEPSETSQT